MERFKSEPDEDISSALSTETRELTQRDVEY